MNGCNALLPEVDELQIESSSPGGILSNILRKYVDQHEHLLLTMDHQVV